MLQTLMATAGMATAMGIIATARGSSLQVGGFTTAIMMITPTEVMIADGYTAGPFRRAVPIGGSDTKSAKANDSEPLS